MKNSSLATRIWLILGLFTIGLIANSYLETTNTRQEIQSCYESNVVHIVESAQGILHYFNQQAQQGLLTEAEAKKRALEAISAMRFDSGNYVFMGDAEGVSISNGIKELVGTNIMGIQDPTGLPLVKHLYEVARQGGGFVDYQWPDPKEKSELLPKTSYANYFSPWQWTLGSGLNMAALQADLLRIQNTGLINLLLVLLTVGILIYLFLNSIKLQLIRVAQSLTALARGESDFSLRVEEDGCSEVVALSTSYNQLATSLEKATRQVHQDSLRMLAAAQRMNLQTNANPKIIDSKPNLEQLLLNIQFVTQQTEALEKVHHHLRELAEKDPETGLLTRQAFERQSVNSIAQLQRETPHSLFYLSVEGTGSHLKAADRINLMAQVSYELKEFLPESIAIGRFDQHSCLFWGEFNEMGAAMKLAVSLQQHLMNLDQASLEISLGVSSALGQDKSYERMFSEAERALLRAQKESGTKVYEY